MAWFELVALGGRPGTKLSPTSPGGVSPSARCLPASLTVSVPHGVNTPRAVWCEGSVRPVAPVEGLLGADHGVGDLVRPVGHGGDDDPAGFAAVAQCLSVVLGAGFVVPEAEAEIDERSPQDGRAFSADASVVAAAG